MTVRQDIITNIFNHSRKYSSDELFRMSKARKYLFLTLGSVFVFACAYYIVQKLPGSKERWAPNTSDDVDKSKSKTHIPTKKVIKKRIELFENNLMYDASLNVPEGELSFASCLLFSLVTQTTVGFAWFVPTDQRTRGIVFLQLLSVVLITTSTIL